MLPWPWLMTLSAVAAADDHLQLPADARGAFAVYCATRCAAPPSTLQEGTLPPRARQATLALERWGDEFRFPDAEQIQEWGQGNLAGLERAQEVVVVTWAAPRAAAAPTLYAAGQAALALGQWFEDLDTGILYDAQQFRAVLERYNGRTPDVTALLLLEAAPTADGDDTLRLVTRGMGKLGLPELVVPAVPAAEANAAGLLLNTAAQALHESAVPPRLVLDLDGSLLRAEAVRAQACGVRGEATFSGAAPTASDPLGPLYALDFDGDIEPCGAPQAAPVAAAPALAPPPAPVPAPVAAPTTLAGARSAAFAQLQGPVRRSFAAGLPAGERLFVKARFAVPGGGTEWLWVEVGQWRSDGRLVGTLASAPARLPTLRQGDEVQVRASAEDVFDYLWLRADGHREGNTTQAFLTRR